MNSEFTNRNAWRDKVAQLYRNGRIVQFTGKSATRTAMQIVNDHMILVENGHISWIGPETDRPEAADKAEDIDLGGRLVTPGLIDCHTHLVYGGNRAREFGMRLEGAGYEEIARAGGGILSTMRDTRALDEDGLVAAALPRLDALIAEGVTSIEIKSGYGLTVEDELKMLRAARRLGAMRNIRVQTTHLAAHALPPEYAGQADAYIDAVVLPSLEQAVAEGLVDAVDAFCENIAFSTDQVRRVFEKAKSLGLPVKLHAEQLSNQHGAAMAAGFDALSCEHLEYLDADGIADMRRAGTVATLLPGAFYFLRESKMPPIEALREAGVPMAISTDSNPGSSPLTSLLLTMNMACVLFRMTPTEVLAGVTFHAARALGLADQVGNLAVGMRADMAVWDVADPAEFSYRIGFNPLHKRIAGGRL